jgi:hypothetical protein
VLLQHRDVCQVGYLRSALLSAKGLGGSNGCLGSPALMAAVVGLQRYLAAMVTAKLMRGIVKGANRHYG